MSYRYESNKQATTEKLAEMVINGSGVRDIRCVLGVSITRVIAHFEKLKPVKVNPQPTQTMMESHEGELVCEDEQ